MNKASVLKIFYLLTLGRRKRKVCEFIGVCISFNKKKSTIILQNYYGSEFVKLIFPTNSPNILNIIELKSYNFKTRLSKLYYFKNLKLTQKTDKVVLNTSYKGVDATRYIFPTKPVYTKEKKRLRNKFRI